MLNHVNILDAFVFYSLLPGLGPRHRGGEPLRLAGLRLGDPAHGPDPGQPQERHQGHGIPAARRRADPPETGFFLHGPARGTRTRDGKLGRFKKGGFLLALETGLDILPLVQKGAYRINRRGSLLIRPGRVEFVIEKPIPTTGYREGEYR